MATPAVLSLDKALRLLRVAIADDGHSNLADLAAAAGLPASTAHRFARSLQHGGFLIRDSSGRYWPGDVLLGMRETISHGHILARTCRPALKRLAAACRQTAHLGVMQDDMVTYLVKESAAAQPIFTREGMQLEAYCSAIGRVLLAFQPNDMRDAYLGGGAFVPLTANTLTSRPKLRAELDHIKQIGFAIEQGEVADDICCIATPVRSPDGVVRAALSIASPLADFTRTYCGATLRRLLATAEAVSVRAYQGTRPSK